MADDIYRPLSESDEDTPPPQTDLPIESYSDFQKALKEHTGASDHDVSVEEVADDITPRRQWEEAPSPENASERPIVRMQSKDDGPLTLQAASDDIRFSRLRQLGNDLRATGYNQDQIDELARAKVASAEDGNPDNPDPPVEVKLLQRFGEEEGEPLNAHEAASRLSDWRQQQEAQRQAELAELVGQSQEQAQAEQPTAQSEPQQPQPQPQQLTPEQAERQQLAAERQRLAFLKRSEGAEVMERVAYDQLRAQVVAEFPSLRTALPTPEQLQDLQQKDPARFQRLAQFDHAMRERQARIGSLAQQRIAREQQETQAASAERAAARAAEDEAFERLAAQHIPNWERNHAEVKAQARKTLVSAGMSEAQISHLWNGDHDGIDVHSSVLQLVLAKAAQWDLASAKAHQVRQSNLPQVLRPGVYRAPDSGGDVRDLQRQLRGATGRRAIEIGANLTRARRASGD
jgi:hypothetical protein